MWTVRLDKYLANLGIISRRKVWKIISGRRIYVNWNIAKKSDLKLSWWDEIFVKWIDWKNWKIKVIKDIVVLFNKPTWYVCSDVEEWSYPSYKKLLENCPYKNILKLAWRLDVDTEGLLVLSDNWNFIHKLISPKHWKEKVYYVEVEKNLSKKDIEKLENWVDIWDYITLPAKVYRVDLRDIKDLFNDKSTLDQIPNKFKFWKDAIILIIKEWKYHQIKRMLKAVGNRVVYLKRLKLWDFELGSLKPWEWKILENKI